MTDPQARRLIENIWKQYESKPPSRAVEDRILEKAKRACNENKQFGFKLGTCVSWFTRSLLAKRGYKKRI
jgi:hypothetical protein